jgi:quercetin 2,3-dioxygenase
MLALFKTMNKTLAQNPVQIYKSEYRTKRETHIFRSLSVFNFGAYCGDSAKTFGALKVFNDEMLIAGESVSMTVSENTDVLLLPLQGALDYTDTLGNKDMINTEEIRVFSARKSMAFELVNPYEGERINYLQIWISNKSDSFVPFSYQHKFDFTMRNQLVPIYESSFAGCQLGIYDRREEGRYRLKIKENGIFAFVVSGTFEFENTILQTHDSLSTAQINKAGFKALSDNAVILIMEIPLNG